MEELEPNKDQQPINGEPKESPSMLKEETLPAQQQDAGKEKENTTMQDIKAAKEPTSSQDVEIEGKTEDKASKSHKTVNIPLIILVVIITALITSSVVCGAILLAQNNTVTEHENDEPEPVISTNSEPIPLDDFGFKFLKLEHENDKNIIYSPLSIKYALAMLSDAAAGESKTQIENLVDDFSVKKYTNNDKQSLANAMFVRDELEASIHDSYTQTLEQKYNAGVIPDPFTSEVSMNNWVSTRTFGMIDNLFDNSVLDSDFVLVNALAVDMNWNNKLQCAVTDIDDSASCKSYDSYFNHENYRDSIKYVGLLEGDNFDTISFNGQEVLSADIGASANRYDIISELSEDYIRSTVQTAYDEWLAKAQEDENYPTDYDINFNIDTYIEELSSNYGKAASSTDFYFSDTDTEQVFAKDLQENEGSTLQYIGIMPKNEPLDEYIDNISADKITDIISNLNDVSTVDGFKEGMITKLSVKVPFFNFDYRLKLLDDLKTLGVTDVFSPDTADLSQMTSAPESYIQNALHKADIDFSNDGIRAAAATAVVGGLGAAHENTFDYEWDVPIEEIELTFDKPFFFIIHDKSSGEVWFTGTVYNPTK